jgi:dCMP deaminase
MLKSFPPLPDQLVAQPSWDELFMRHAYLIASKSKDLRTKIGAVLVRDRHVISEGYNGMPMGVCDCDPARHERPEKYFWFEHAERNSIYVCARYGHKTEGAVMFTQGVPCADCTRGVIQAGISEVVVHAQWQAFEKKFGWEKWLESGKRSSAMLEEAGIPVRVFDGALATQGVLDGKVIIV